MEFKQSRTALSDYRYALDYLKKLEAEAQLSEKRMVGGPLNFNY